MIYMTERVSTGIKGLDQLIEGGFPENSTILLSGGPGTGKTLFCCQYLWEGLQKGEKCLYITVEEDKEGILADAKEFGWNFEEYDEKFKMEYINPFQVSGGDFADYMKLNNRLMKLIGETEADRVVIDSVSVLSMSIGDEAKIRKHLYELINILTRHNATTLMTSEKEDTESGRYSRYGVAEFVSDGLISLKGIGMGGEMGRRLVIEKMRRTNINEDIYPLEFSDNGLKVEEPEKGLSL